ncbi:hypothetical protein [Streptomyces marianii]|uniref:PE-PGRS family protein n=1 Tax=Streptomyces marianii TaxID=1817406 RepID=A0A5R9EG38_9ACTN|nr:hypothetical protein [Streptomyces marianii]TLQ47779.1 hypothetical protein FEF34_36990 [Streptomyces marianii]
MTSGRCCRAVRAATFAATCVLLAAIGHVLMSGIHVPWWAVAAAFVAACATGWALTTCERGFLVVTSATVLTQGALHSCFSLAQAAVHPRLPRNAPLGSQWVDYLLCGTTAAGSSSDPAASGSGLDATTLTEPAHLLVSGTHAGTPSAGTHLHHTAQAITESAAPAVGHAVSGHASPFGMLAAHLAAAVLCGVWLAHGERAFFRLLRAFAGWLLAPLRTMHRPLVPAHRSRIRVRRSRQSTPPRDMLLVSAFTTRGPPARIAVV